MLTESNQSVQGFTPGPWSKPYFDKNPGDEGWWIHNGQRGQEEYAVAVTFRLNPCAEADAHLISASPEMYGALRAVMRYGLTGSMANADVLALITTALDKACPEFKAREAQS